MPTAPALTSRQSEALRVISSRQVSRKCGPTIREVAAALKVSGNAVQGFVRILRQAGHVAPDAGNGLVLCSRQQPLVIRNDTRQPIMKPKGKIS